MVAPDFWEIGPDRPLPKNLPIPAANSKHHKPVVLGDWQIVVRTLRLAVDWIDSIPERNGRRQKHPVSPDDW